MRLKIPENGRGLRGGVSVQDHSAQVHKAGSLPACPQSGSCRQWSDSSQFQIKFEFNYFITQETVLRKSDVDFSKYFKNVVTDDKRIMST